MGEEELLKQHIDNYKNMVIEMIQNNTKVFLEDLNSSIEKPPLDSMDVLQNKLLELAKNYNIVLNSEELGNLLSKYRKNLVSCFDQIQNIRINELMKKTHVESKKDTVVFYKKDFVSMNKNIKSIFKDTYINSLNIISKEFDLIFQKEVDSDIKDNILEEFMNYMNSSYQKQLLESFDIKLLLKDTTLINLVKEQTERHLFTIENSRLLKEIN